ncbi:FAD-dependent oxidoreductase [Synechococcus sp. PCC 7336]|uniref:FAD-dependent oxidoreductase n=1 Tax=Synechococcus sp. PCC 7336 TaxID=195250 RepID=UPI0004769E58|nr:FAD-dependent oxidoreductase [Synechococcus sp. PCC 7336]
MGSMRWLLGGTVVTFLAGVAVAVRLSNLLPVSQSPTIGAEMPLATSSPDPAAATPPEIWTCEVVVIGGSLGGVAAAAHAMQAGARTCLIELTPWLGGQISSQGVSAIDESLVMRQRQNFSRNWNRFKQLIAAQTVALPSEVTGIATAVVADINGCWVGDLCFPPAAGHAASETLLQSTRQTAPDSRWATSTAFKGAEWNAEGDRLIAINAVRRIPRSPDYIPTGRLSRELHRWYDWESDATFEKIPLRLQPVAGRPFAVIDATDTGELVGWANLPHRLGSESYATTGEPHAVADNPDCTQAFTFPFALAIADDGGRSRNQLAQLQTGYAKAEHRRDFSLNGFNLLSGRSFFHYRRIVSLSGSNPLTGTPGRGDIALVNWNRGNDWNLMNPPLILTAEQILAEGQDRNWLGGLQIDALRAAENRALLFSEWLMQHHSTPTVPLAHLSGPDSPLQTQSGLSMYPYIREGRRILGRAAYGDDEFMLREQDIRFDLRGGRDWRARAIAVTNYAIDIHGCRYRNWEPSGEAASAPINEFVVKPIYIPPEALIPQRVDNLLIGGKSIAVTHIVNAATRTHYGEWSVGGAAGAIAAWYIQQGNADLPLAEASRDEVLVQLQNQLRSQGLRLDW